MSVCQVTGASAGTVKISEHFTSINTLNFTVLEYVKRPTLLQRRLRAACLFEENAGLQGASTGGAGGVNPTVGPDQGLNEMQCELRCLVSVYKSFIYQRTTYIRYKY